VSDDGPLALVVEDDQAVAGAMERVLERKGFTVAVSGNGAEALERIRRGERFALVVSDVFMPVMDGITFQREARALWPELDEVLVFVTGSGGQERAKLAAPCFPKPVDALFFAYIRRVLERWRQGP